MRFHKSLTSTDLIRRGPVNVARMIASEFWRAQSRAHRREEAVNCLWRARELMGVLEVINLPQAVAQKLLPYYAECSMKCMFNEKSLAELTIPVIQEFGSRLAEVFDQTAQDLQA